MTKRRQSYITVRSRLAIQFDSQFGWNTHRDLSEQLLNQLCNQFNIELVLPLYDQLIDYET